MSMSCNITGIKPPDEKWKKMKALFDACNDAEVSVPDEVWDFFDGEEPDPDGVVVSLEEESTCLGGKFSGRGYTIHVDDIPKDVKIIKFENSW